VFRAPTPGRNTHARETKLHLTGLVTVSPLFGLMIWTTAFGGRAVSPCAMVRPPIVKTIENWSRLQTEKFAPAALPLAQFCPRPALD
jgi:hypothetical protein